MTRELREENGNCFSKLGMLNVIHVIHYDGVCFTCLVLEHYFKIACNVYFFHTFHPFMFIFN